MLFCTISLMAQKYELVNIYGAYNLSGMKSEPVGKCIAIMPIGWAESNDSKVLYQRINELETEYLNRYTYQDKVERLSKTKKNFEEFKTQRGNYAEDVFQKVTKEVSEAIAKLEKEITDSQNSDSSDAKDIIEVIRSKSLGGKLYSDAEYIGHGVYLVNDISTDKSLSWGCVNEEGNFVLPCKYHIKKVTCDEEHNRICVFNEDGMYGVFDYNGKQVLPIKYSVLDIVGNYIVGLKDNKWGMMDMNGKAVYPFTATKIEMWRFNEGIPDTWVYMIYNESNKMAFYDKDMKQKTPFKYSSWTQNDPIVMGCGPDNGVVDTLNVSEF